VKREIRDVLVLVLVAAVLLAIYGSCTPRAPALADEFIYLANARYFADALSLNTRFYDDWDILRFGHPHHEWHAPGYIIILGSLIRAFRDPYWTAVLFNAAAYATLAALVRSLSLALTLPASAANTAGVLALLLPAYLPYAYWAMPEVLLGTLFVGALVIAARHAPSPAGAFASGLVLGLGVLVRETLLFGLPAWVALLVVRRGRWRTGLVGFGLFVCCVHLPLQHGRPVGGSFWQLPWGHPSASKEAAPSGATVLAALSSHDPAQAVRLASQRIWWNVGQLTGRAVGGEEKAVLLYFAALATLAALGWRPCPVGRGLLLGLWVGFIGLVTLIMAAYSIGDWGGLRYLMFLMPAFLPFATAMIGAKGRWPWLMAGVLGLSAMAVQVVVWRRLSDYRASRQRRWERLTSYVEERTGPSQLQRIVLPDGWLYGLKHSPVEVISSLTDDGGRLRSLEDRVWFDYLVVPAKFRMLEEIEKRARYRRVNAAEPSPPLYIYRRLK
jgi:hypothetical protein